MADKKAVCVDAEYLPQIIEEYKDNPFIEALPPIYSAGKAADLLTVEPGYHEAEREMDAFYRFHCLQRLSRYFQPLDTHIDIEQRVSRSIRQSYVDRNPVKTFNQNDYRSIRITASGFTMIGMSGVGKTKAMERVLSLYPQCVIHIRYKNKPFYLKQLVWMKLDCPYDGSIKGLCLNFFKEMDRVLGSEYSKIFPASRNTVDAMLVKMSTLASTHGLGLLVIDEIQHLSQAKSGGSEKMLNFFVTLVNTIGVPVVLIGTTKAMPILQSEFRQARRGSGQGDLFWERMPNDLSWDIMLQSMWKYQWTKTPCPLTKELKDTLYDESQGIMDLAVKLYAIAQTKAIADGTEAVTPELIREVAAEKLRLVKPMLDALRSGNMKKIMQYEDIRPISIEDYIAVQAARIPTGDASPQTVSSLEEQAVLKLLEMDISSKTARRCVKKAFSGVKSGQSLSMLVQKAFKLALNIMEPAEKSDATLSPDENDMRQSVGENAYQDLKNSGAIAEDGEW